MVSELFGGNRTLWSHDSRLKAPTSTHFRPKLEPQQRSGVFASDFLRQEYRELRRKIATSLTGAKAAHERPEFRHTLYLPASPSGRKSSNRKWLLDIAMPTSDYVLKQAMLTFREQDWMAVPGATHLWVDILPENSSADDLRWSLEFRYVATGAKWRRVRSFHRPRFDLTVSIFRPCVRRWEEFEDTSFWFRESALLGKREPGTLISHYSPRGGLPDERLLLGDSIWRVSERTGRFLTVELAAFGSESPIAESAAEMLVPSGVPESDDFCEADFLKENAQVYLSERVPFGVVSVQVPRNVSDPEAYALARARSLLGLEHPWEMQIVDYVNSPHASEIIHGNLYVHLHFHGFYED